jgi:hypothetical protein
MSNVFSILELLLNHEIQLHEAIKKKQYGVCRSHLLAMMELIPKNA